MITLEELIDDLEGRKSKLYSDTMGVPTIGCGRNLRDVGLSDDEIDYLRNNDCARARDEAAKFYWFPILDPVRQLVVLSMLYQLGLSRFLTFERMIIALKERDYTGAAREMRDSQWAKQTPNRVQKLSGWMETGSQV
jgi:lysozyme